MPKLSRKQWAEIASDTIKDALAESETTYAQLAKMLAKQGLKETETSITQKLKRGTFSAVFLLATFNALGIYSLEIVQSGD